MRFNLLLCPAAFLSEPDSERKKMELWVNKVVEVEDKKVVDKCNRNVVEGEEVIGWKLWQYRVNEN